MQYLANYCLRLVVIVGVILVAAATRIDVYEALDALNHIDFLRRVPILCAFDGSLLELTLIHCHD